MVRCRSEDDQADRRGSEAANSGTTVSRPKAGQDAEHQGEEQLHRQSPGHLLGLAAPDRPGLDRHPVERRAERRRRSARPPRARRRADARPRPGRPNRSRPSARRSPIASRAATSPRASPIRPGDRRATASTAWCTLSPAPTARRNSSTTAGSSSTSRAARRRRRVRARHTGAATTKPTAGRASTGATHAAANPTRIAAPTRRSRARSSTAPPRASPRRNRMRPARRRRPADHPAGRRPS